MIQRFYVKQGAVGNESMAPHVKANRDGSMSRFDRLLDFSIQKAELGITKSLCKDFDDTSAQQQVFQSTLPQWMSPQYPFSPQWQHPSQ